MTAMTLAISDGMVLTSVVISSIGSLVAIAVGVSQVLLSEKVRKIESQDAQLRQASLDRCNLRHEGINAAITMAVSQGNAELSRTIAVLGGEIRQINARLERGDEQFGRLGEEGTDARISLVRQVEQLKVYVEQHCASKDDLVDLSRRFSAMEVAVAKELAKWQMSGPRPAA